MADELKSFLFSLGNSADGPVGFCARVVARTKEEALEKLKKRLPKDVIVSTEGRFSDEYIEVYFNTSHITCESIDEINEPGDEEEYICPECDVQIDPEATLCPECGADLSYP